MSLPNSIGSIGYILLPTLGLQTVGVLGPSFAKTGDKVPKLRLKTVHKGEKEGTRLSVLSWFCYLKREPPVTV
jgi:hypothetical protein